MILKKKIENKLEERFKPSLLQVFDESHLHKGHLPILKEKEKKSKAIAETHFRIFIVSSLFSSMSRIERHRTIHTVLEEELKESIHALALSAKTPDEVM